MVLLSVFWLVSQIFFKSRVRWHGKKFGIRYSEFTDNLLKMALKEVTENLIRNDREERLKQVWSSLFYVWKKT